MIQSYINRLQKLEKFSPQKMTKQEFIEQWGTMDMDLLSKSFFEEVADNKEVAEALGISENDRLKYKSWINEVTKIKG